MTCRAQRACALALLVLMLSVQAAAQVFDARHSRELVARLDSDLPSVAADARDELLSERAGALPALRLALEEGGFKARREALLLLAVVERERLEAGQPAHYMDDLVAGLADEAESVRRAAVRGLVYMGELGLADLHARFEDAGAPPRRYLEEVEDTVLARQVEEALVAVISPDGGYGTYPGAFAAVDALGPGAVPICLRIFSDPHHQPVLPAVRDSFITTLKVRFLAGSSLYEIGGEEIAPELRRMYDVAKGQSFDPERIGDYEANLATVLSLRGDCSRFDRELEDQITGSRLGAGQFSARMGFRYSDIANMYLKSHRNRSSVSWYEQAARDYSSMSTAVHVYNIACAYSRMHEKRRALDALRRAVLQHGYSELSWLRRDGDLDYIREDPEFKRIEAIIEQGGPMDDRVPVRRR